MPGFDFLLRTYRTNRKYGAVFTIGIKSAIDTFFVIISKTNGAVCC